jgi:hypothetical protein
MAINSSVHDSTGYTPFFLAHGADMQLPIDLALPAPAVLYTASADYADALLRRLDTAFAFAQRTMHAQVVRAKRRYDTTAKSIRFCAGDKVYFLKAVPGAAEHPKFHPVWTGPCTITTILGDVTVRIRHDADGWEKVVHIDRLCRTPTDANDADESPDTLKSDTALADASPPPPGVLAAHAPPTAVRILRPSPLAPLFSVPPTAVPARASARFHLVSPP